MVIISRFAKRQESPQPYLSLTIQLWLDRWTTLASRTWRGQFFEHHWHLCRVSRLCLLPDEGWRRACGGPRRAVHSDQERQSVPDRGFSILPRSCQPHYRGYRLCRLLRGPEPKIEPANMDGHVTGAHAGAAWLDPQAHLVDPTRNRNTPFDRL